MDSGLDGGALLTLEEPESSLEELELPQESRNMQKKGWPFC